MDRASMKAHAKEQIKGKILILLAITLIISVASGAISFILGPVGGIATLLISGPIAFAQVFIYLGITNKSRVPKVEDLLVGFKDDNFLRTFVAYIRLVVFTFLWSLLFWIPGIIKSISYSQMFYLLAEDDKLDPGEAQKQSMEMMEGHKWEYFVLGLSFIPWYLLCGITLGIATIWVVPYVQTTLAEYHVRLVNGGKSVAKEAKVVKDSAKKSETKKSTKTTKKSTKK